jgi:hypothetical protein
MLLRGGCTANKTENDPSGGAKNRAFHTLYLLEESPRGTVWCQIFAISRTFIVPVKSIFRIGIQPAFSEEIFFAFGKNPCRSIKL